MALKWCVCIALLLVLGTSAQNINLVIAQTTQRSPKPVGSNLSTSRRVGLHKVFDRKLGTTWTGAKNRDFEVFYVFDRGTSVTKYKIRIHPSVKEELYPKSWILEGAHYPTPDVPYYSAVLDNVTDAQFTNGQFVGKITNTSAFTRFSFTFTDDNGTPGDGKLKIALSEIAFIGPKSQLNDPGFPGGAYPCTGSMELIKPPSGANKSYFGRADLENNGLNPGAPRVSMKEFVRDLFALRKENERDIPTNYRPIYVDSYHKSDVYLGCIFEQPTKVLQYGFRESRAWGTWGFKLQGNKCEPDCNKFGSDGWVTISTQPALTSGFWDYTFPYIHPVEVPDFYKAYRFVLTPSETNTVGETRQEINDINLFQCRP